MTPVFTQEVRQNGNFSNPVAGATNPLVAIPWAFAGPNSNQNIAVVSVYLDGDGVIEGNSATVEVIWAYQQTNLPGPEESLATITQVANATDEANGFMIVSFSPNDLSLPTSFTQSFSILNPYSDGASGFFGVSFHSTITTPNQSLSTTVIDNITQYTTGANANKYLTIFGDCPVTIGGTAVDVANSTLDSSGGTVTALVNINSTSNFNGSASNFHRKVELIKSSDSVDVYPIGSSTSSVISSLSNQSTASSTQNSFTMGETYTLKITIGSGSHNSPTDDFRIVRYSQIFTVV